MNDRVPINPEFPSMGLYDSDTGESIKTLKVVDISWIDPSQKGGLYLMFGRSKRGRIVKIHAPYERGCFTLGVGVHYFVDEQPRYSPAWTHGLTVEQFQVLVEKFAPRARRRAL